MALGKAVVAGAAAALAIPWALAGAEGPIGDLVRSNLIRLTLGGTTLAWSWTLFCVVTLIAWAFLAWAER
jgi:hypothetical protein